MCALWKHQMWLEGSEGRGVTGHILKAEFAQPSGT